MPFADVAACRLHYDLQGPEDAPTLVLSNSLGTDLHLWEPQLQALAAGHRVLRYDTRGHGRSSVPPGPYTMEGLAGDVVALLDHLSIGDADFCGLSLGGMTGLQLACAHSARVRRIVVCCAAAQIGTRSGWDERMAAVRADGMSAIAPSVLARWFTERFRESSPSAVAQIETQLRATPLEGYLSCCAAIRDTDLRGAVSSIGVPTLVLAGRDDPVVAPAAGQWLVAHIPGAQYVELSTAHLANVEDPVAFTASLTQFLAA